MPVVKVKAVGQRGSWFAEVEGIQLPCVHDHWVNLVKGEMRYRDPNYRPDSPNWMEFVGGLTMHHRVVLTRDKVINEGEGFEREGYIAVFDIADIRENSHALEFRFTKRVAELT